MGKTALATNIAFNIARNRLDLRRRAGKTTSRSKGGVVAFFSLEMSAEQLATRLLSDAAEIESDRIRRGKISKHEYERLADEARRAADAAAAHRRNRRHLASRNCRRARAGCSAPSGLDCIVVDYLQLVTAVLAQERRPGAGSQRDHAGLKALAKDLKVPVIALSQLSRQVENREDKRPQLSDLRESGSIEQDADVGAVRLPRKLLSRARPNRAKAPTSTSRGMRQVDEVRNQAEVIIGKQRHGPIGKVKLFFDSRYTRFGNLSARS